jgi:phage shock protein A
MSKSDFDIRLAEARKAGAKGSVLTVVGALLVAAALIVIIWQYRQVQQARDAAAEAQAQLEISNDKYDSLASQLNGELKVANNTIKSLNSALEGVGGPAGHTPAEINRTLQKSREVFNSVEQQSRAATATIQDLRQEVQQTMLRDRDSKQRPRRAD